jgi:SAM-dependent methyltransferase
VSTAAGHWRDQLAAWAIPQPLLDAVPDSPYSLPPELWRRAQGSADEAPDNPTMQILTESLGESGSLLDVGAGTGRVSLPFGRSGHQLTAVEKNPGMAGALRAEAAEIGADVELIDGVWPDAAEAAGVHDVVVSAHVVYDVAEIDQFVEALHRAARRVVVLEMTPRHPWASLSVFYEALHGLDRPDGPTVADLVQVVQETVGATPTSERWTGSRTTRFVDREELLAFYQRRLVLPIERTSELEELLDPLIIEDGDWLRLDLGLPEVVTLWWGI